MNYQIIQVSPQGFLHSRALDEVAMSLHYGFNRLGISAPLLQNMPSFSADSPQAIILGANFAPDALLNLLPPNAIIYNLEQIEPGSPWLSAGYLKILQQYQIWDYSDKNIEQLAKLGITKALHCPVGYVAELSKITKQNEDIDILFYGSVNDRRKNILAELQNRGLSVVSIFGLYGSERDDYIGRAKIVLNIHFYQAKVFEIVRVSYLLANQIFVLSEDSPHNEMDKELAPGMVLCPYEQLVSQCMHYIKDKKNRDAIASKGFQLFSQIRQDEILAKIISIPSIRD